MVAATLTVVPTTRFKEKKRFRADSKSLETVPAFLLTNTKAATVTVLTFASVYVREQQLLAGHLTI